MLARTNLAGGETLEADQVMLAVGRVPNVSQLGLETVGIEPDKRGAIPVDAYSKTTGHNVWAIGDVTDRLDGYQAAGDKEHTADVARWLAERPEVK